MRALFGRWAPAASRLMTITSIIYNTTNDAMSIDLKEKPRTSENNTDTDPSTAGAVKQGNVASKESPIELPTMRDQAKSYCDDFTDSASTRMRQVQNRSAEETGRAAAETAQKVSQETVGFVRSVLSNTLAGTSAAVLGAVKGSTLGWSQIHVLAERLEGSSVTPEHLIGVWTRCYKGDDGELIVSVESEELPESEIGLGKAIERTLELPTESGNYEKRDAILIPFRIEGQNEAFAVLDNSQSGGPVYFWIDR